MKMSNDNPIGIFDSGIGGLTVLKEIGRMLPAENIIYLGDTARVPYGIRSPETVTRYSFECTEFLLRQNIKILVIACNTASAISLSEIKKKISVPVIGVIEPGSAAAASATKNKRVGVIGTDATIKSSAYQREINTIDEKIQVFGIPCPLFVPLVEEGWTDGVIARLVVERYLNGFKDKDVDTIVLGCTHYPLLKDAIQDVMGDVKLIDSAVETAKVVKELVADKAMMKLSETPPSEKFFVTDSPERFINVGEKFLQKKIKNIEKIKL